MFKKKAMNNTKIREKGEMPHYNVCEIFVKMAMAFFILQLLWLAASIIYVGVHPVSELDMTFKAGNELRINLPVGYVRLSAAYLPEGNMEIMNEKVLCLGVLIMSIITNVIPMLLIMNYIRKMLKTISGSHSPFVNEVVEYIQKAGKLLVIVGVFSRSLLKVSVQMLASRQIDSLSLPGDLQVEWIFAGVLVLLIGDIFCRGCKLQEFSDETI